MAIPNSHPSIPINLFSERNLPTVPVRYHSMDMERHLSTPLLPSNLNFPSSYSPHVIPECPHTFPTHFPQPQFNPPVQQFYLQQPSYTSDPRRYQQLPAHRHHYRHPFSHSPTVPMDTTDTVDLPLLSSVSLASTPKTLPAVEHIPLLSDRSNFIAWNNGVRSLILYLGYAGHITNPATVLGVLRPDRVPSYPPTLSTIPSSAELATSRIWWQEDHVVSHILTSRLTPSILSTLPFDDDELLEPRTARTIYELLRQLYSVHDHASGSALYSELCNLQCGGRILNYVAKWRAGINQLRTAKFIISFRIIIERFLDRLPTSVPYDILRFRTMETIDNIPVDDVTAFIKLTDEVLKIDNTYRRKSQPRVLPNNEPDIIDEPETALSPVASLSVVNPPVIIKLTARRKLNPKSFRKSTTPSSPAVTTAKTSSQPRGLCSSLICTNCGTIGHTVDKCFETGGGLEGKREQYLASRNRAQAHLAHLTNIIDGNLADESDPPPISLDASVSHGPDVIVEPETCSSAIATLSITLSDSFALSALPTYAMMPDLQSSSTPIALATSSFPSTSSFPCNSLLDSGCTTHIFRDHNAFWTYDTTLATPVETANCGILNTLARGSVRFRITSGDRSCVVNLKNCLHAPDAPINLISIGSMTEKGAVFTFAPGLTSISLPTSQRQSLPNFSFNATVLCRLSFLHCDFNFPPLQSSSSYLSSSPRHSSQFLDSEEEERKRRREDPVLERPRTPEPSRMDPSLFNNVPQQASVPYPLPQQVPSSEDIHTQAQNLSKQVTALMALNATLEAQYSAVPTTIQVLESKVEVLEGMLKIAEEALEAKTLLEEEAKAIADSVLAEWRDSVEGWWGHVQECEELNKMRTTSTSDTAPPAPSPSSLSPSSPSSPARPPSAIPVAQWATNLWSRCPEDPAHAPHLTTQLPVLSISTSASTQAISALHLFSSTGPSLDASPNLHPRSISTAAIQTKPNVDNINNHSRSPKDQDLEECFGGIQVSQNVAQEKLNTLAEKMGIVVHGTLTTNRNTRLSDEGIPNWIKSSNIPQVRLPAQIHCHDQCSLSQALDHNANRWSLHILEVDIRSCYKLQLSAIWFNLIFNTSLKFALSSTFALLPFFLIFFFFSLFISISISLHVLHLRIGYTIHLWSTPNHFFFLLSFCCQYGVLSALWGCRSVVTMGVYWKPLVTHHGDSRTTFHLSSLRQRHPSHQCTFRPCPPNIRQSIRATIIVGGYLSSLGVPLPGTCYTFKISCSIHSLITNSPLRDTISSLFFFFPSYRDHLS